MSPISYHEIRKTDKVGKTMKTLRGKMVKIALAEGIKPAARICGVTPNTVRNRVERVQEEGEKGLCDRSRRPHSSPNAMLPYWRFKILDVCKQRSERGARIKPALLKRQLNIPYSAKAIGKVARDGGYIKKKYTKPQQQKDLHALKRLLRAFEVIQVDIKYLTDIPELVLALKLGFVPKYQITARCVRTGALWIDYMTEKTVTNTALFIGRLLDHLQKQGVQLDRVTIQTDNGKEFTTWFDSDKLSGFELVVLDKGATIRHIPFGAKTYQSDVEVTHRLIEDELYAAMPLLTEIEFLVAAKRYLWEFNTTRRIRGRDGTPLEVIGRLEPDVSPAVVKWRPMIVDRLLNRSALDYFRRLADT